jgi:drug/metabolite transporter (DMT)-like permease
MNKRRLITTAEGTDTGAFGPSEWGLLLFAGVTWGASFLLIAEGVDAFAPGLITFLRILFGFATVSLARGTGVSVARSDWPRVILLGIAWMAFPLTLFPIAQQHVSSSVTGMINGATPLFVAAIATVLLWRLPGRFQLVGIGVGLVGIVLIGLPTLDDGASSVIGVGLILIALVSYGLAFNIAVPLQQTYGSLPVLWRAQLVALILTLPLGLVGLSDSTFEMEAFMAVVLLGVGGTGLAYMAATSLAGRVGSTRSSVAVYISPPVALLLGVLVRNETVAAISIAGALIVLIGAWLTTRADAAAPTEEPT